MFRFLLICAVVALAVIWVDAQWDASGRVLALRVRTADEIRDLALEKARKLGREWVTT